MDILDRKMLTNNLMSLIRKKYSGGNFGLGGGRRQQMPNQSGTGMGLGYGGMPGTMMSSTPSERRPWQKGKALEDYMMKKLRDRDNEEFYKGWKGMGSRRSKGIRLPGPDPSGMHDPTGTDTPRPLQDYSDWDWDEFEQ